MAAKESVTDRVSKSAIALAGRQIFSFVITVAGGILLARLLTIEEFGIYAIVAFAFGFLKLFGDVGLAASLIRQEKEPRPKEYAAVFTVQQVLVIIAVLVFWIIAPWLTQIYDLAEVYKWLFRLVALSMMAASFMVIPQVQLQREIDFQKIAVAEVLQAFAFNAVAVALAWQGYGAFSLGWGIIAHTLTGVIFINIVHPWPVTLKFDWKIVKEHLRFGLPFQGTHVISTINSALNPVLIALLFGMASAGFVEWAVILVGYLQRPLFLLNRLLFPTYSKLQQNKAKLSEAVNYTYVVSGLVFFGSAGLLFALAPEIVTFVYGNKWLPALTILYLLVISKAFIPMSIINGALADALGWAKTVFYISIFRSVFLLVSTLLFIIIFNSYIAFGYAMICTEILHIILYILLKRELPAVSIVKTQWLFAAAAVCTVLTLTVAESYFQVESLLMLVAALAVGGIVYLAWSYLLYSLYKVRSRDYIVSDALLFLKKLIKKKATVSS